MSWLDLKPDRNYDDSFFNQDVETANYVFRTQYNSRAERWYLQVRNSDDEVIATTPLIVDTPLLRLYNNPELFSGQLILTDTDNSKTECARDDLNERCNLLLEQV